jgi:hypothetical protein
MLFLLFLSFDGTHHLSHVHKQVTQVISVNGRDLAVGRDDAVKRLVAALERRESWLKVVGTKVRTALAVQTRGADDDAVDLVACGESARSVESKLQMGRASQRGSQRYRWPHLASHSHSLVNTAVSIFSRQIVPLLQGAPAGCLSSVQASSPPYPRAMT